MMTRPLEVGEMATALGFVFFFGFFPSRFSRVSWCFLRFSKFLTGLSRDSDSECLMELSTFFGEFKEPPFRPTLLCS